MSRLSGRIPYAAGGGFISSNRRAVATEALQEYQTLTLSERNLFSLRNYMDRKLSESGLAVLSDAEATDLRGFALGPRVLDAAIDAARNEYTMHLREDPALGRYCSERAWVDQRLEEAGFARLSEADAEKRGIRQE